MQGKQTQHQKAINPAYRKAILKAIEDLHDCHLRSSVDAIRKHVMSSLESDQHPFNEVVFMKTLKTIVQVGEVEQHTFVNCALSPEYKKRRAGSLSAFVEQKKSEGLPVQFPFVPETVLPPTHRESAHHKPLLDSPSAHHKTLLDSPKEAPKRKVEHDKYKIMPKPLFDKTEIRNPMDTH